MALVVSSDVGGLDRGGCRWRYYLLGFGNTVAESDGGQMTAGSIVRQTGMGIFTLAALVFAACCFVWLTFKNFEPVAFPVVKDFTIKQAYIDDGSIYISGTMDKVRDCQFTDVIA